MAWNEWGQDDYQDNFQDGFNEDAFRRQFGYPIFEVDPTAREARPPDFQTPQDAIEHDRRAQFSPPLFTPPAVSTESLRLVLTFLSLLVLVGGALTVCILVIINLQAIIEALIVGFLLLMVIGAFAGK